MIFFAARAASSPPSWACTQNRSRTSCWVKGATTNPRRGPHRLEPALVAASRRGRLLDAMAESVARIGYTATTVADVLRLAGVSRKTFYEQFADKQACFLAAFDHAAQALATSVNGQPPPTGDVDEQLRAGYAALCSTPASMPNHVRAFAAGVPEAGAAVQDCQAVRREASMSRLRLVCTRRPPRTPGRAISRPGCRTLWPARSSVRATR
ncbi:TetR/AcrR family transcriptional regulator [Streptomyces sp. NPDC026659]|uniref:TetR/AcrR family transcriptional regulator n=1 Tax=Streptomyces sp. NPDC026659 TaxID=3155123 RepID=UPI00340C1EC4